MKTTGGCQLGLKEESPIVTVIAIWCVHDGSDVEPGGQQKEEEEEEEGEEEKENKMA